MKTPYDPDRLKSVPVVIRVTQTEAKALKAAAEAQGVSVSEHARQILFRDELTYGAVLKQHIQAGNA